MSEKSQPIETFNFSGNEVFKLKEFFKEEINSRRRFEAISTLEELFTVLEDRDALNEDVLLKVGQEFRDFVYSQRKKGTYCNELDLPQSVVRLLSENLSDEWENLGVHLKISDEEINRCRNLEDVLMKFKENCRGISSQEMTFRLNRGLDKCGRGSLKSTIIELMSSENF